MGKSKIFSEIRTLNKTIKELTSKIIIEELFNIVPKDNDGNIIDDLKEDLKITYGVQVRLSKDTADDFFPFSYCYPDYDSAKVANKILPGKMIPDLLNEFSIKEIQFTTAYNKNKDVIEDISIDSTNSILNTVFFNKPSTLEKKEKEKEEIENWLKDKDTFLHVNIKELVNDSKKDKEEFFVWICGEDPDVTDEKCGYLTNIMVITNKKELRDSVKREKYDFIEFMMWLKSRRSYDSDVKFKKEAIKSAKAAIMSRNMSHNLGSHVMSYLKQHLGSVKDMINDRILSNVINEEKDLTTSLNKDVNSTALPFLLGLGHFISYLQERQDFIATIATDYIPYYSTINFKDDIYDVLNPDKRAKRHPERSKTSNMEMDNILLGNIARSEGLGRPTRPTCVFPMNDNEVEVLTENISDIVLYFGDFFDGNPTEEGSNAAEGLKSMRDFNFSLPGGIVGRQAFFSILENIIRNAAKHGKWHDNGELGLTFNIYKADSKNIPNNDNDNGDLALNEVFQRYYFNAIDKDDLYFVTITDNAEIGSEEIAELRAALQDDYVDASGVMRDKYKGLKEMRISSSWIRSMRDESDLYSPWPIYNENDNEDTKRQIIDSLKHDAEWKELTPQMGKNAPLLYTRIRALKYSKEVENRNLQYIFCVPIPKKVAIITKEEFEQDNKEKLKKYYWRALSIEEFKEESNKSFEFIICDDSNDEQLYGIVRPIASSRVYSISQITEIDRTTFFYDIKNKENPKYEEKLQSYEESLYKYLAAFDGEEKILIEDDRAKESIIHADEDGLDQIRRGNVLLSGSPYSGKYIYRTHHETYNLFEKFMTGDYSQTEFVEGISGNNSTDRLVRNETKDNIWFYRHLHAIKQHIAIFDERIYSRIGLKTSASYSKDHIATTYAQKNVFVFTLVEDVNEEDHTFGLYGIVMQNGSLKFGEKYCCLCGRLATLSYSKELGLSIEFSEEGTYICNKFDYISIHQGILDKLYKSFGLKEVDENHDLEKTRLSNQLYILLSRKGKQVLDQDDGKTLYKNGKVDSWKEGFVPGLIIHSGRSKPSSNDMPQKLPFLQYAAIEHATLDCKFSLVELLDYARYEE